MGDSDTVLMAFWLPDLVLLSVGSLVAGVCARLESPLLPGALWFVSGTIAYATLYCLAFAMMTNTGWLGVVLMTPAMIITGNFAIALSPALHGKLFRRADESCASRTMTKTVAQIIFVWGLVLFFFPWLIVLVEAKLGVPRFAFTLQSVIASMLFALNSSVGIMSAITMAKSGQGTPLPMDSARKLVTTGTYAVVRNPMAISGIGQGLAVGLFLGSPLVLLYSLLGAAIWQTIIRPLEEDDLLARFGEEYERYRENVRCWIPRWR